LDLMPAAHAVGTGASCAILMDAASGRVLYSQNIHEKRLIASITKLMTALTALEFGRDLKEVVTIDPAWAGVEGSSIYLQAGEQVTLETLLYGMLLRSGNDAAQAVAGYCGGTVDEFVEQMNRKAQQLGMANSSFANPSGLNAEGHYSTAYDMALLARACLENETLSTIVGTKAITLGTRIFTNHNKLLWRYEGCIGLKTGYTEKAGRTLVSAAQREGVTLICVTLNDPNDWADHSALFDYGVERYERRALAQAGEMLCRLPVEGSLISFCPVTVENDVDAALAAEEKVGRELRLHQKKLTAPVAAGTSVGELVWTLNGEELVRTQLVAGQDIPDDRAESGSFLDELRTRLDELAG